MLTYTRFFKSLFLIFTLIFTAFSAFSQTATLNAAWSKVGSRAKPLIVASSTTGDVNGDGLLDFIAQPNLLNLGNTSTFFSQSTNDWRINSTYNTDGRHGYLGDHNGDGKKDVVLIKNNQIAVFNGSNTGLPIVTTQLYIANCDDCGFNTSFDGNGDINKDGYDDLIVGAPLKTNPDGSRGALYIFYGSATGLNLSTPTIIDRANYIGTHFGSQVRYAGDVNKDGFADILVGSESFAGRDFDEEVFIIFGKTGTLNTPLSIGGGGRTAEDYAHEIGSAGDINGDGFADIYISAAGRYVRNPFLHGKVEIVYGKANGSLDASIFALEPPADVQEGDFGKSVCRAGDFNDDGFSDLAITLNNKVLIYLGSAQGLSNTPRFEFLTCCSPTIRYAGDVDKDGLTDILVGEQDYNSGDGRVQLVKGRPSMIPNFGVQKRDLCIANPKAIFQDSSIGTVSQIWDFGDGTQSALKNPEHTYTRVGIFAVKLTTKDAKGHSWSITKDSSVIVRAPMLGGNYTVGEGANFPDMNMVNTVCACGVSGNVNVRFKNGIYAPPTLRLENVETNGFALTFESESGNRDSVQFGPLFRYPFNWTAQPNIIVKNAKNITFKKLSFERAYNYTDPAIQLSNSENIKFDNCIFPVQHFEGSKNIKALNITNLRFDSCTFYPSYPLLDASKCNGLTINKSNTILNLDDTREFGYVTIDSSQNIICTQSVDFYLEIKNTNAIKIDKCRRLQLNIKESKKIEITENADNFSLTIDNSVGFKIHKNRHPTTGAYSLNGITGIDTEGYNLIANNFIGFPANSSNYSSGGIHVIGSRNVKIYHNSVVFESFQGENCKGVNLRVQNSDSVDVRNNLFLQVPNTECAFVQIDNNQRYTANFNAYCNNRFFNTDVWNSHSLLGFKAFKEALGQDQNSILGSLKMQADLLTPALETAGLINNAATYLTEVADDIDGKPRLQTSVDIGALEFNAPNYRDFSLDTIKTTALEIGDNAISVLFTNKSASIADSCRFAYQVNDYPIVREKWTGRLAAFTSSLFTFSPPLSILKGKTYSVKIWVENTLEATRQNDTLLEIIAVPMAGTYSIGNNSDFKDVNEFYKELDFTDTKGDVIGLVKTGNYTFTDPQTFRTAPQRHWVTLKGEGTNPDNVHLIYDFIEQPYMRFENMTLEALGVSNNAIKIEINNCVVKSAQNPLNERYFFNIAADSSVVILNSQFKNLSYALQISINQVNFQYNDHSKIWIENCHFSNVDTAIVIGNISIADLTILKNTIDRANMGIYMVNINVGQGGDTGKAMISQNRIINCNEIGIRAYNTKNALFANNFVQGKEASMEFRIPTSCKIINNSCFGTFQILYTSIDNYIFNNSFVAEEAPMIADLYPSPNTAIFRHANYNNYFSINNKPCKIVNPNDNSETEMSLNAFKQLFQTDTQSIAVNPLYKSTTDMHLDTLSPLNGAGGGIFFNVTTDIDGQERDIVRNDIGADEIKPLTPAVVMPGDANFDGVVDMYDLVSVGVAMPQQLRGTVRANPSIEWLPQASPDWSTNVLGKNAKHTDTNGDGMINANDTLAISRNYAKTHTYHLRTRSAAPLLYLSNLPTSTTEGNWVNADINLGSVTDRANDVYALLFSIQYDSSKIKSESLSLKFDTCWIGQSNQRLTMTKDIGRLYAGIVRTTGTPISGNGVIGQLRFQLKDGVFGKTQLSLLDGVVMNNSGVKQELAVKYDTLNVNLKIPPTINVLLGASQTTLINKPFAAPLKIQVKDAMGKLLPNLLVRFTLPSGNLPSATFVTGQKTMTSLTNTEGVAQSADFVANSIVGTFNATIMLADSTSKRVPLTNIATTAVMTLENTQLDVFPNPFTDIITLKRKGINTNNPCIWALYDIVGRQLAKGQFNSESINISLAQYSTQLFILKTVINGINGVYKLERLP